MALLHVLVELGFHLHVGHLHHALRAEADADAEHVRNAAQKLNLPFTLEKTSVRDLARCERLSLETAGRRARLQFFETVAETIGAQAVAVAHHRDDQIETILANIATGCGWRGLGGMVPARPIRPGLSLRLVRPLLNCSREEIMRYLRDRKIAWREDRSNRDLRFRRNRIRHLLWPQLRERLGPNLETHLLRLAAGARRLQQRLDEKTEALWRREAKSDDSGGYRFRRELFGELGPVFSAELIRRALAELHGGALPRDMGRDATARAMDVLNGIRRAVILPGKVDLRRKRNQVIVRKEPLKIEKQEC